MNKRSFPMVLAASFLCLCYGRSAEAQSTVVLDAGLVTGTYTNPGDLVDAQTFTPTVSGTVTEIRHGVRLENGVTAYNLYVVDAPGDGPPPSDYTASPLFVALDQTSFMTGPSAEEMAKVPVAKGRPAGGFQVTAGRRYALIIEPTGRSGLRWYGNNADAYPGGQGYVLSGGSFVPSVPADFSFQFSGLLPPPSNDSCASCTPIGLGSFAGTNVTATTDAGVVSACGGIDDVWYCFTAPCAGPVTVSTCAPGFDTILAVYPACGGPEIVCNDDCPGTPCLGPGSCVTFTASCCVTYRIRVSAFFGQGAFTLTITQSPPAAPPNNNIANRIAIGNVTDLPFSTCGATTDGPAGCSASNDIWYTYTPTCQGVVTVETCGSCANFDTFLAVYTGTIGNLTLIPGACNDDAVAGPCAGSLQSYVQFPAPCNMPCYIRVGGFGGQTGCGDITVSCTPTPPFNDLCPNAIAIGPGVTYGTTTGATSSPPPILTQNPCGASGNTRDVWYTYTPPCNGQLTLDTCQLPCAPRPRYDTVLSLYTGNCAVLTQVAAAPGKGPACNDDFNCGTGYPFSSRITARVSACVTYKIRVSGWNGASGGFALNLGFVPAPVPNDNICNATLVPCGTTQFSTCNATTSPTPGPGCPPFFNDIWYSVTPTCTGTMTIDTCGSPCDTMVSVYSGSCTTPVSLACNDDAGGGPCAGTLQSYVSFAATAGTKYYVRVGTFSPADCCGVLNITCPTTGPHCPAPPPCQAMSNLFDVTGFSSGVPWAFSIGIPTGCCFNMYVPSVPGVPTSGNLCTDEDNLAMAFVNAINARCPQVPPIAVYYPHPPNVQCGWFSIKACDCLVPPVDKARLRVGPAGTPKSGLCLVQGPSLPTIGLCSFNPEIEEIDLPGTDCNGNGEDDYIDILAGTSADLDQNNVPDECDGGSVETFCYPGSDGVIACPCGNPPAGGGLGCNNFGTGPAQSGTLTGSGAASLAADTIVLQATGENNTSTTVFWTGNATNSPPGVVHGAGVRCVTGLKRLYTGTASGGAISRPGGGDPSVSVRTAAVGAPISAGETRYYFNIYRDPQAAGPCGNTSSTINLTNAGAITWKP